ncbi:MAG: ABC transporter ATP-binding protein [Lachnospiraceae bacterium]|nr:ABC transporter ATP-binding protein [Lachnospiraceae bacterium]
MIFLENVKKEFKGNYVLKGINLNIQDGEVYGLVGRNGAGKTTLLNIIAGISQCSEGTCKVNNEKIPEGGFSYLPDLPSFYDYLSIEEYVEFLLGTDYKGKKEDYIQALEKLNFKTNAKIKSLSRGNRQKLGIYVATMKNPGIVLLDEPTSALDPVGRREVMELIKQLKNGGTTVILSTHILADLEVVCDKIGFLNEGYIANEFDLNSPVLENDCDYELNISGETVDEAFVEKLNSQLVNFTAKKGFGVGNVVCKPKDGVDKNIQQTFLDEISKLTCSISSIKKVSFLNLEELMVEVLTK